MSCNCKKTKEPVWLDTKQACEYLKLNKETLYNKMYRGEIPYYKLGKIYFDKNELEQLILKNKVKQKV